jgi:plasmid stabilization system protein ParE
MAALTIRWTRQAIADVDHIYDFIAANNTAAARAMVDRIDRAIDGLVAHLEWGEQVVWRDQENWSFPARPTSWPTGCAGE